MIRTRVTALFVLFPLAFNLPTSDASHGSTIFWVTLISSCGLISAEYEKIVVTYVDRLRISDPELDEDLGPGSFSNFFSPERLKDFENLSQEQIEQAKNDCDPAIAEWKKNLVLADSRLTTPMDTWKQFILALKTGDSNLLEKCLYGGIKNTFFHEGNEFDASKWRNTAKSFAEMEIRSSGSLYQTGYVKKTNGRSAQVWFSLQGLNWKIANIVEHKENIKNIE